MKNSSAPFIFQYAISLILLFIVPDWVYKSGSFVHSFVMEARDLVPALVNIGRYSQFPDTAQAVYFIQVLLSPIFLIFFYKNILPSKPLRVDDFRRLKWAGFRTLFFLFVVLSIFLIAYYLFLPGTPDATGGPSSAFEAWMYGSKFGFSIGISLLVGVQVTVLAMLIRIFNVIVRVLFV